MKRLAPVVALLVGCGSGPVLPPLSPPPVDVEVRVAHTVVASGEPIVVEVTRWTASDWMLPPTAPLAESLEGRLLSEDGPALVGDRTRTVTTYELSGADGSYVVVVPPVEARGPADQTRQIEPPPVFVDIGRTPPALDGLVGVEAVTEPEGLPTTALVVAGGIATLGFGLLIAALVFVAREKPVELPRRADVAAREDWAAARTATTDDHALALALSQVFRRFLQAVTGYPMLTRTTREIVRYLEQQELLDDTLRPRARRVLDATDRLKFAREGGGSDFFDALEADFLAVVDALSVPTGPEQADA